MATSATIQQNQVGLKLQINVGTDVNLTGSTASLIVTNPSKVRSVYSATVDPANHLVNYITDGTEFILKGTYSLQVHVDGDGFSYDTVTPVTITVNANL